MPSSGPSFLNRTDELAALDDNWSAARSRGRFFVLWGRRRVGKTELLNHFGRDKRLFYFEATDATEATQLNNLADELSEVSGNPIYREAPFPTWKAAFSGIEQYVGDQQTMIVLDEFQYLAHTQRELASLLSSWWRKVGRNLPVLLVISGSEIGFFRGDVLAGQLYGRRDAQLQVKPFSYREAALFVPKYSADDKVRTYAVCGGTPYYLQTFDDSLPISENLLRNILYRHGILHEEAELLLRQELSDPLNHFSVLEAVARGATRTSEISDRTRLSMSQTSQTLKMLEKLELIKQRVPVTAGRGTKKTSYAISDGFLNFYFRFVEPYRSRLHTRDDARRHLERFVLPALDHFVSKPTWESICQQHMLEAEDAVRVGSWWGPVRLKESRAVQLEVDAVTLDRAGKATALGSCKWTNSSLGHSEVELLSQVQQRVPALSAAKRYYFYSRTGFDESLVELAESDRDRYRLFTPQELFG